MRTKMYIIAAIFVVENPAIAGHKHGYRVGQEKHSRGQSACHTIGSREADSGVFEVYSVHQVVERHVGVATGQARKHGSEQSRESNERIMPEGTEKQIEPDDVGLQFADRVQNADCTGGIIKRPASLDRETLQFRHRRRECVREHCEANERIALQFVRKMKSVLAESTLAGRKSRNQTNLHSLSGIGSDRKLVG